MGAQYHHESIRAHAAIFHDAATQSLDDDTRWELIRGIKQALAFNDNKIDTEIRELTAKQDLLTYFAKNIADERAPGRGADLKELQRRWTDAINRK
jgi:hypothetical protein